MIMTRYEIDNKLTSLYQELEIVKSMDEATACRCYNVDSKKEAVASIKEEIDTYECAMAEHDDCENREMNFYRTADAPYLCW